MTAAPPPPTLDSMRAGTRLVAGMGHATVLPDLDFETYSAAGFHWVDGRWVGPPGAPAAQKGLGVVGAPNYTADPSCEILSLFYDLKDGAGRRHWRPGLPPPADLHAHIIRGGLLEAWNVAFERWVWEHVCVPRLGWPAVDPAHWRCAMAKARAHALPGALGKAGDVLALEVRKDADGERLLKKFSVPQKPTQADPRRRRPTLPDQAAVDAEWPKVWTPDMKPAAVRKFTAVLAEDIEDTQRLYRYNEIDIASEAEASSRVPDIEGDELAWWQAHEAINHRGVHIDVQGVDDCIAIIEQAHARYNSELQALTGIDAASKVQQLIGWLAGRGVHTHSLDEDAVEGLLARLDLDATARRVLEIRAAVGSASVKKVFAMRNRVSADGRLRDLYVYHGARTGRSTGEGPQPTNLPKAGPDCIRCGCGRHYGAHRAHCPWCGIQTAPGREPVEWNPAAAEDALAVLRQRSLAWAEYVFGDALHALAGVLRALYDAAPGHDLISTDFNSIEAVGLAMISGEQWRIDVFRTHGKIYEMSASTAFKVPFEDFAKHKAATGQHLPIRQSGKVLELACLAPETLVLTHEGYVPLVDLRPHQMLWDGIEWVRHQGLVHRGRRPVIGLAGTRMTPDHKVLCGHSWLEAKQVASNESTLYQSLATGSANLPWWVAKGRGIPSESELLVRAGPSRIRFCRRTSYAARRLVALLARGLRAAGQSSCFSSMPTRSPTTNIGDAFSTDSLPQSGDATTQKIELSSTTVPAGSSSTRSGVETSGLSYSTWSLLRAGTTRASKWIVGTLTGLTRRGTSGSLPGKRTCSTADPSPNSSVESWTWSSVYDIAHVGPRNRFTILTSRGPLIVHNCGYQGWVGAAHAFGMPGTDDEIKDSILAWRRASPAIEWLWGGQTKGKASSTVANALVASYSGNVSDAHLLAAASDRWDRTPFMFGVEGMAVAAMSQPGTEFPVARLDGSHTGITFIQRGDALYCRIPSGRYLTYHRPRFEQSDRGGVGLSYEGYNTNPKNGPVGWIRMNTWGGRLVENINQAACRDILAPAVLRLEATGYPVVLHVYDEIVSEVPEGFGSIDEFEHLCTIPPAWAPDWPIRAPGGYRAKRYRKG